MAAFQDSDTVMPLDLQSSQSELKRFHSEADYDAATQTDDWDDQGLTLINSHVAVSIPIEVETSEYDVDQGPEMVGPPLSNLAGWKVKVRPSTSSMHCVSFHDLTYQVTQRKLCKRLPNKTILNSVR